MHIAGSWRRCKGPSNTVQSSPWLQCSLWDHRSYLPPPHHPPFQMLRNSELGKWQCISFCSHPFTEIQRSQSNQYQLVISSCILGVKIARQPPNFYDSALLLSTKFAMTLLWRCALSHSGHSNFSRNRELHDCSFLTTGIYKAFCYWWGRKCQCSFPYKIPNELVVLIARNFLEYQNRISTNLIFPSWWANYVLLYNYIYNQMYFRWGRWSRKENEMACLC